MELNKDYIFSEKSYFEIPTFYDKINDIYFSAPESKEFVSKFYEKDYWDEFSNRVNKKFNFWKIYEFFDKVFCSPSFFNKKNLDILISKKLITKETKILEIGVGVGRNIIPMKKKGYNIKGLEIDYNNVSFINRKLGGNIVTQGNYEDIDLKEKYDLIYMRHVLEHFYDINSVVNKFKNNLNSNGILFIDVPCADDKFTLNWSIHQHPHIYHFTKKSLIHLFEENNYKVLDCFVQQRKTLKFDKNNILKSLIDILGVVILRLSPMLNKIDITIKSPVDLVGIFQYNKHD